ncbi:MAG TPA: DUF1932 domain-containing protein, partial [Burkholderiales bacterium]|nr:DUF1932 domain-containing protein [Burkholderiales bacterium]
LMVESMLAASEYRVEEQMREVAETLEGIGIEPLMAAAAARRQQWVADLGVKELLGGAKTEQRAELLRAIRTTMGRKETA